MDNLEKSSPSDPNRREFLLTMGSGAAAAVITGCAPLHPDKPHAPVADQPNIEVHFLDFPDLELNPLGARGIGEIGLAGVAAAITAAVHHATGVRIRELPVKIEDLLA